MLINRCINIYARMCKERDTYHLLSLKFAKYKLVNSFKSVATKISHAWPRGTDSRGSETYESSMPVFPGGSREFTFP